MTHALVVLNPVSGTRDAGETRATILNHLQGEGWACDIHETAAGEKISDSVRRMVSPEKGKGYDLVVASGGDGTLSAVASGLVGHSVPLGLVPSGTGNALARDLHIPLEPTEALRLLTGPHRLRPIDALDVGSDYYFLNISIGVSAAAIVDTERHQKQRLGLLAYLITMVREVIGLQPARFDLEIDDEHRTVYAADIVVANSGIIGVSALHLGPQVTVDDGVVAVCVVRARTILDYIGALWSILLRRGDRGEQIECLSATKTVRIASRRRLPVQADGEPLGHRQVTARVVPHAVTLIVPA